MRFHASSKRARFFERMRRPSASPREHERVDLLADRYLVGGITDRLIASSATGITSSDL